MGNETSAGESIHNSRGLEVALRGLKTNKSDVKKNCWDSKDRSDNITVFDSDRKIRRTYRGNQSDAIRGNALYTTGVHFFEFNWNNENDKIVSIGVATQEVSLTAKGMVLGRDDQSVGFNMVAKQIYFNNCPVKSYPPGKPPGFKVPEKIVMILDLDDGTMSFKSGTENYGVAMSGLRHVSQELCIAAELNKDRDALSMTYMGSSGNVRGEPVVVATPTGTAGSNSRTDDRVGTGDGGIRVPHTAEEYVNGLEAVIKELKKKDPNNITQVEQMVVVYMKSAFLGIDSNRLRRLAAEKLAEIDGAKVIMEYYDFLLAKGKGNKKKTKLAQMLLSVSMNHCDCSLVLCTKFGECGFVESLIKYITGKSRTYTHDEVTRDMVTTSLGILHSCSKATENKPIYRKNNFLQKTYPYTHPDYHSLKIVLTSLFGISYICEAHEYKYVIMRRRIAQQLVRILSKAVVNRNYQEQGWHAYDLAVGISNVSVNPRNSRNAVQAGAVEPLTEMLDIEENYDCECALNAIWSLTNDDTKIKVAATGGLLDKIDRLTQSSHEGIKQSAIRLKVKLQGQRQQLMTGGNAPAERDCDFAKLCRLFKASLNIPASYFSKNFNTCFCAECHGARGDRSKYARGKPPKDYGIPVGWYKFALQEPPRAKGLNAFQDWHRAFHGTVKDSLKGILEVGEIAPAGRAVLGGRKIKEMAGHFCDGRKPTGFNTKQLFLSPSMRYSGVDAYAKPSRFQHTQTGETYNAKVAFQVLIAPGSYKVGPQTIGAWTEIDPDFSNQEMEWSTDQQGAHVLSGLLVKLYRRI